MEADVLIAPVALQFFSGGGFVRAIRGVEIIGGMGSLQFRFCG
jgi:hypothetical protein